MDMARRSTMAQRSRTTLAALLGAAVVTSAASAPDRPLPAPAVAETAATTRPEARLPLVPAEDARPTLGQVIEARLQQADQAGRHHEIDRLARLWLTLNRRDQLDRVVDHGDRFVAVALRNQDISAHRDAARRARFVSTDEQSVAALAETLGTPWIPAARASGNAPDELLDAEETLARLDEPYRTAVALSLQGLSRREVADHMGVSHAAVRKWMQRLRERWSDLAA
jgi:DNA-directed RNA polymerase specialized sigma24 family protein